METGESLRLSQPQPQPHNVAVGVVWSHNLCYHAAHPVTVNWTMTLGEVLQILTMIVGVTAIIVGVRIELRTLKDSVSGLTERLGKHETTLFSMFGQLQRVIGIVESDARTPR